MGRESSAAAVSEKTSTYQLIMDVGAACGETAGILDIPYLRRAHQRRQRIIEAAGSAALDGRPTSPERLYAWLGDVPQQAQANLGAEAYAAEIFVALSENDEDAPLVQEAVALAATTKAKVGRDVFAGAAFLFSQPDSITPEARIAFAMFMRGVLGPAEPALSPLFGGAQAAAKRGAMAFDRYMAERLERAARQSLANARTLRAGLAAANSALSKDRASSHIRAFMELLFAGHPLSISSASHIFRVSRLAARKHLLRLEAKGLAEAVSRGKTGVVYVARDGLMTFYPAKAPVGNARANGRLAVSAGTPLSPEERARLDAVTDDVADRMRELDRLLLRLAPRPPAATAGRG